MSENRDPAVDPNPKGRPGPPAQDPDATISGPLAAFDPDQTVGIGGLEEATAGSEQGAGLDFDLSEPGDAVSADAEAAMAGTLARFKALDQDPDATVQPAPRKDDPDATFSGPLTEFDPDATISSPGGRRRRANPFAPKALPEALQANLAALGGLNPLVAYANPILSAVPQIRAAQNHPDPALLKETLQDLIEAFEAGASSAGTSDEILEAATYALCCLADDAAASTAWGKDWEKAGLLERMRSETTGGEEFFSLLEAMREKPAENADLLELMYICLALGFEGRYRGREGGREQLDTIRKGLHALVTRRRPRPDGLSARWQGIAPGAAPGRPQAAAPRAVPAAAPQAAPAAAPAGTAFPWRGTGIAVAALVLLFAGYKAMQAPAPVSAPVAGSAVVPAQSPVVAPPAAPPTPAPDSPRQGLEKALAAELQAGQVALTEQGGRLQLTFGAGRQFASGRIAPDDPLRALAGKVGAALERVPGTILVRGYSDSVPLKPGATEFPNNRELSAARARAVAQLVAAALSQPQRVSSEGAGEVEPVAPNDTEQNRARNRRVVIFLGARP